MKIETIKIHNIKNVSDFELDLQGATVLVTAGNNKGKSTILRSIIDRLRGEKPEMIVKHGEKEGEASLELTDGSSFLWSVVGDREKLCYITKEGVKTTTFKEIARRYFPVVFDIDKFLQSPPRDQIKILQNLVGIDFTDIDSLYKKLYEDRTYLNRMLTENKPNFDIDEELLKQGKIDVNDLTKKLERVNEEKLRVSKLQNDFHTANGALSIAEENITRYTNDIALATKKLNECREEVQKLTEYKEELYNEIGNAINFCTVIDKLNSKLSEASDHNLKVEKMLQEKDKIKRYKEMQVKVKEIEKDMKNIRLTKLDRIRASKLPKGLEFEEDQITVDGLPMSKAQLGTAKLYITALKLAALQLGEVKTLYFDASILDRQSLNEVLTWAKENDLQLLIERADFEGGEIKYEFLEV